MGGSDAEVRAHPWQVALKWRSKDKSFCGGVLITERHVLTAAHCAEEKTKKRIKSIDVVFGAYDLSNHNVCIKHCYRKPF